MTNLTTTYLSDSLVLQYHNVLLTDTADSIDVDLTEAFDECMSACMAYKDSEPTSEDQARNQYILACAAIKDSIKALTDNLQKQMDTLLVLKKLEAGRR